jgi:sialate O-acetylesterase
MSRFYRLIRFPLLFLLGAASFVHGGLMMPSVFSSGMVLQADQSLPVWGWGADPGSLVTVEFANESVETVADAEGQ